MSEVSFTQVVQRGCGIDIHRDEAVIDEAPMVYKPKDEIIANIAGTVRIINLIKPVFNFKASN